MKRLSLFVLLALFGALLSACGQTPAAQNVPTATAVPVAIIEPTATTTSVSEPTTESTIEPTVAPTIAPTVASTVAPISLEPLPLTAEGLTPLLFEDGDLPDGWATGKLFEESPVDYGGPSPAVVLSLDFVEGGSKFASGHVVLWVFGTQEDTVAAYKHRAELIERSADKGTKFLRPSIGDQAFLAPGGEIFVLNRLAFSRCSAVVEVWIGLNTELDMISDYATRLDTRLAPSVCK